MFCLLSVFSIFLLFTIFAQTYGFLTLQTDYTINSIGVVPLMF